MIVTNTDVVYTRKTEVKIVDNEEARNFENKYHLQGSIDSKINLGLYKDNKLIYLMTFGKPRFNSKYEYEILRMCNSHKVIGGAEKLFKYFLTNFNPTSIVTYADFSKFRGNVYKKLGFEYKELTAPGYIWYNIYNKNITTRYKNTKSSLIERGLGTINESETEIMNRLGYYKIHNSGDLKFEFKRE